MTVLIEVGGGRVWWGGGFLGVGGGVWVCWGWISALPSLVRSDPPISPAHPYYAKMSIVAGMFLVCFGADSAGTRLILSEGYPLRFHRASYVSPQTSSPSLRAYRAGSELGRFFEGSSRKL